MGFVPGSESRRQPTNTNKPRLAVPSAPTLRRTTGASTAASPVRGCHWGGSVRRVEGEGEGEAWRRSPKGLRREV